jgi:hypothetical protein
MVGAIGVGMSEPRMRAIRKRMVANGTELSADTMERLHDPVLVASVRIRVALVLGILFLMVSKVNLVLTVLVLLFGLVVGLVTAAFSWRPSRKATSPI